MGNKVLVDKTPSLLDDIINYSSESLPESPEISVLDTYQHLSIWSFSEKAESIEKQEKIEIIEKNEKNDRDNLLNNTANPTSTIESQPIDLSNIQKTHFLLNSNEVYIILLIYKKDKENIIEQSPFPTGFWGIIESSSNMTPRGLMYAFPANNDNLGQNQNLESFLLSKRDFENSEFKYMLFIWNGKSSSAILRSHSLMKAYDLDKALNSPDMINFLYKGYSINRECIYKGETVKLSEIINNTIENSEDSRPSSEKISNYHENVYLLKWLYPLNNTSASSNSLNPAKKSERKNKKSKIFFKGFNKNFLLSQSKIDFYSNFKCVETANYSNRGNKSVRSNNKSDKNSDNKNTIDMSKSQLNNNAKKQIMMPPKLNLNINLNKNVPNMNLNNLNNMPKDAITSDSKNSKSSNKIDIENETSEQFDDNDEEYNEDDYLDDADLDLNLINNNDKNTNATHLPGKLSIPKLIVTKQSNVLNDELISQRSKKKAEEEDSLNEIPGSTLIKLSQEILQEENLENKEEIDINSLNENYNLKDAERKKIINDYYSKHLSEIIPGFLYLSSYNAAKNKELLEKNKITHIINCAADFCQNVFESNPNYKYLSFYLKDHVIENVECVFYECIEYIEAAKEKNGRVLVHCIQGISRSVSVIIAYLIYKNKYSYDKAFSYVQSKRQIASPNFGFSIQLQNFYMRLFEPPENYRYYPKIFAVGLFQLEQQKIVCRLMNEPFFENKENGQIRMFDKRGVFIIINKTKIYLWLGKKISPNMKDLYLISAKSYIKTLQKYENAPNCEIKLILDSDEPDEFIKDLLIKEEKIKKYNKHLSEEFSDWNNWYKEFQQMQQKIEEKKNAEDNTGTNYSSNENSDNSLELKKGFYLYPSLKPEYVLDFDDLGDNQFLLACVNKGGKRTIYRWKGNTSDLSNDKCNKYKSDVIKDYFKDIKDDEIDNIDIVDEVPLEESDEFLSLL